LVDPELGSSVYRPYNNTTETRAVKIDAKAYRDSKFSNWSLCPPYSAFPDLPSDETAWTKSQMSPDMSSMYDDIVSLYETKQYEVTRIPELCRRIVLWSWRAQVHLNAKLVTNEVVDLGPHTPWEDKKVGRLVRARLQMQTLEEGINLNMNALGIGAASQVAEAWEGEDWKSLQNTIEAVERRIDVVYEFHTQRAAIKETQTGNEQARGVRYLTASLTAGIFAMVGDYSAGAKRFWVFWVVAVPLMLLLCLIIFAQDFQHGIRLLWRSKKKLDEENNL
jgi:hypothetical protein